MDAKAINSSTDGCLVLLLPIAFLIIFLFNTWPLLLALVVASVGWSIWQRYQWQKWSQEVNPLFHRLIQENQGRITALDLAMKANFSAETAKRYLNGKAEEFGAQRQEYEDQGTVYYFITSSILGSIFNDSEPTQKEAAPVSSLGSGKSMQAEELDSAVEVTELESQSPTEHPIYSPATFIADVAPAQEHAKLKPLDLFSEPIIQSELAKRLEVHSSTVYKRRDDPDFAEWTRSRDPDGIAWKFLPDTKEFLPLEEQKAK